MLRSDWQALLLLASRNSRRRKRSKKVTIYLLSASGDLDAAFPWSINGAATSTESESAVNTAWSTMWASIFGDATLKAFIPPMTSLSLTTCSTASAQLKQTTKSESSHSLVGTSTSPALPFRTSSIITLRSDFATRWGRGRWFFPGLATNALATDGYFYSQAAMTALANAFTAAVTTFQAAAQLAIAHRTAITGGPAQYSTTPVTHGDVSDAIASQRRRADKRQAIRTDWTL